jgi:polysaccharide export outer membrane protein
MRSNAIGRMAFVCALTCGVVLIGAMRAWPQTDVPQPPMAAHYVVGPQDVLGISIWNQPSFSGKFPVDADGGFTFPLIGKVLAGGLTLHAIREELIKRLKDGYLKDPQIAITVEEFRSQRIFVMGEVREPGSVTMTGPMSLVEALAQARGTTTAASKDLLIVRAPGGTVPSGPLTVEQVAAADAIRVDLAALQNGDLSKNVPLRDGDTIFVPRAGTAYVFGQVRTPGLINVTRETTVLQALALAGGVTDRGAPGRIRIIRVVNGRKEELKAKMDDLVQSGDTLMVPQRYF